MQKDITAPEAIEAFTLRYLIKASQSKKYQTDPEFREFIDRELDRIELEGLEDE